MIGERIFPLVQEYIPELAGKITAMLLEIDHTELLQMLQNRELLDSKIEEAVQVLRAFDAKELQRVPQPKAPSPRQETLSVCSQRKEIGERLFLLVQEYNADFAGQITGTLLEIDKKVLLHMLRNRELLFEKVKEAVQVLQHNQAL
jgi:hypothetical protein